APRPVPAVAQVRRSPRRCGCGRFSTISRPQPHLRGPTHLKAPPTPPSLHTPTAASLTHGPTAAHRHRGSYPPTPRPHLVRSEAQCQRTLTPPSARNRPTPSTPPGSDAAG